MTEARVPNGRADVCDSEEDQPILAHLSGDESRDTDMPHLIEEGIFNSYSLGFTYQI